MRLKQLLFVPLVLSILWTSVSTAQPISIQLTNSKALLHLDSANWSDAWFELDAEKPNATLLTIQDLRITDGKTKAKIISVDTVSIVRSNIAVSFILDNSGSMFH